MRKSTAMGRGEGAEGRTSTQRARWSLMKPNGWSLMEPAGARNRRSFCGAMRMSSGREAESFNARMGQIAKAAGSVLRYACGTPWDALSSSVFTHDAIHLNERGCGVLVELLSPLLEPLSTAAASAQSLQDPLQQ